MYKRQDEDEYTQGQWMKKASYNGVYRAYASGFTIGNYGYLCGGNTEIKADGLGVSDVEVLSLIHILEITNIRKCIYMVPVVMPK